MSANNFILITKDNRVIHCDADTGPYNEGKQCASLEEAVQAAQDICEDEIVEYGISFERRSHEASSSLYGLDGQNVSLPKDSR